MNSISILFLFYLNINLYITCITSRNLFAKVALDSRQYKKHELEAFIALNGHMPSKTHAQRELNHNHSIIHLLQFKIKYETL